MALGQRGSGQVDEELQELGTPPKLVDWKGT